MRTLRHPGVIKILETVEVFWSPKFGLANGTDDRSDRDIYLHCNRANNTISMAGTPKESERRDLEMGLIHNRGRMHLGCQGP